VKIRLTSQFTCKRSFSCCSRSENTWSLLVSSSYSYKRKFLMRWRRPLRRREKSFKTIYKETVQQIKRLIATHRVSCWNLAYRNKNSRGLLISWEPFVQFVDMFFCEADVMLNSLKLEESKKGLQFNLFATDRGTLLILSLLLRLWFHREIRHKKWHSLDGNSNFLRFIWATQITNFWIFLLSISTVTFEKFARGKIYDFKRKKSVLILALSR